MALEESAMTKRVYRVLRRTTTETITECQMLSQKDSMACLATGPEVLQ